ncbi:ATP-binding protein, partial [Knoellia aerolata]
LRASPPASTASTASAATAATAAAPVTAAAAGTDLGIALSPSIRAHLAQGVVESGHRPIAVAFVQFSGTDVLHATSGPRAVTEALDVLVRTVQRACSSAEVTFFETDLARDGGKFMLTAGAPRSAGRDIHRLLGAALAIVTSAGVLPVRAGLASGHVFAGDFGPSFRRTYSIKGDTVNLAARLLGRAAPGELVATAQSLDRIDARVEAEALEPFRVKGKRHLVEAARVLTVRERTTSPTEDAAFIGRAEELVTARAAVGSALAGSGTVLDIVGEAGIGKSRLAGELGPEGVTVLSATTGSYDTGTPYATVRSLTCQSVGLEPWADPDALAARLTAAVARDAPALVDWLPLLARPFSIDLEETPQVRDLDVKFRRGRLEELALELLSALLPSPTVIRLEDAHLMDEASGAIVSRAAATAAERAWALVVTRRDAPTGYRPAGDLTGLVRIDLGSLPAEDAGELLESLTQQSRVSIHSLSAMVRRASGNPFFLMALARRADDAAHLPDSVESVLLGDMDGLGSRSRTLLRHAAVLGTRFDTTILAEMVPGGTDPVEVEAELSDYVRPVVGTLMEFRHTLMRDVAYEGLPYRLRRDAHERAGRALLESTLETDAVADLLSMHFHAAAAYDQAWTYALVAGGRASETYAYGEAADCYERAVEAATHLPELSPASVSAAYASLGEARQMAGLSVGAIAAFRKARGLAEGDAVRQAGLLHEEARIVVRLGRFPQALRLITRGLGLIDGVPGPEADRTRARMAAQYGFVRHLQGRGRDAVLWCARGAAWAEASGDRAALAYTYNALHLSHGASTVREERPYGRLALAAYEELDDLRGQALCLGNLAIDDYNAGRWDTALAMFARAADIFRRVGDVANEGNEAYNQADVLVAQGRFADALEPLRVALRLARGVDDEELVALSLREGARAHAGLGRADRAEDLFTQARALLVALRLPLEVARLDAGRAEAMLAWGRAEDALELLDGMEVTDAVHARVQRTRACALWRLGRMAEAREAVLSGISRPGTSPGGVELALLRVALGLLPTASGPDETDATDPRDVLAALGADTPALLGSLGLGGRGLRSTLARP